MHFVARKAARVCGDFWSRRRLALKLTERIEPLKLEAAIIAKQLMQAGHLKYERGILVAALNARALASGTPHRKFRVSSTDFGLWLLAFADYDAKSIYDSRFTIYELNGEMGEKILTDAEGPGHTFCLAAAQAAITMAYSKLRLLVRERT